MASQNQLKQLKILMDIDVADTSQDEKLMIELDSAIEVCVEWFNKYACNPLDVDSDGFYIIPASIMIGIKKYVESSRMASGVRSESIGGMSVSYGGSSGGVNSTGTPLDDFYALLEPYRCRKVSFIPMRKR